eukprot:sb/3469214/
MILCIKRAKIVQCKIRSCLVWRSSDKDLYQHIRDDHPDRKHFCDVCPMAFVKVAELTRHHLAHSGYRPHKCKECGKSFSFEYNLHRHQIFVHSKIVMCRIKNCGVRLPKSQLYEHIETTHPKQKFQCDICPISFSNKADLNRHRRIHSGIKPFQCEKCGKRFSRKEIYKTHDQLVHSGEHPFKCKVCGKRITRKGGMKNHMRTHTGEKPFPCSNCGKTFLRSDQRHIHEVKCSEKQ